LRRFRDKSPDKSTSYVLRATVGLGTLIFLGDAELIAHLIFINWFIHDYFQNMVLGPYLWYLNSTGPIDKFQKDFGGEVHWFIVKFVITGALLIEYYG
jgi:hypothetical protein